MKMLKKITLILSMLGLLFPKASFCGNINKESLSFLFGKNKEVKQIKEESNFHIETKYNGEANNLGILFNSDTYKSESDSYSYYTFKTFLENNYSNKFIKNSYSYCEEKDKHAFVSSVGYKTKEFKYLVVVYGKFGGGFSYSKYKSIDDYKFVASLDLISRSLLFPTIKFHQRFNKDYDWWLQLEKEFKPTKLDILSFVIKYQWDYESYYDFIEREEKYLISISF